MTYSQKYALVHFISPIENEALFHMSEWPLHTTLADVFAINRLQTSIDAKLATMLAQTSTVETAAMDDIILGTTQVVLLDKTPSLVKLHTDIVSLLEKNNAVFNTPEFTKDGFLPHCTLQMSGRLNKGNTVTIDSVSLVDLFPSSDWEQRKVLATFKMKE